MKLAFLVCKMMTLERKLEIIDNIIYSSFQKEWLELSLIQIAGALGEASDQSDFSFLARDDFSQVNTIYFTLKSGRNE